jgi:hypothetical protein
MRPGERLNNFLLVCVTVGLAVAAGLLVPLFGGSRPGTTMIAWTPPPASPTVQRTPTRVRTATPALAARKATAAPTATTAAASPTPRPASPTATASLTATASPTALALPTATAVPADTVTVTPAAPTAATPAAPLARIVADPANLRSGPGRTFPVIAVAQIDEVFTIIGRSDDGAWWQLCCVQDQPVWVAAELVEVSGPTDQLSEPREASPGQ